MRARSNPGRRPKAETINTSLLWSFIWDLMGAIKMYEMTHASRQPQSESLLKLLRGLNRLQSVEEIEKAWVKKELVDLVKEAEKSLSKIYWQVKRNQISSEAYRKEVNKIGTSSEVRAQTTEVFRTAAEHERWSKRRKRMLLSRQQIEELGGPAKAARWAIGMAFEIGDPRAVERSGRGDFSENWMFSDSANLAGLEELLQAKSYHLSPRQISEALVILKMPDCESRTK